MAGRPPKLSMGEIEALERKGLSKNQIAEILEVTRQSLWRFVSQHRTERTPRQFVAEHFPWKVPAAMMQTSPHKRMRDHGEWMSTGGEGMSFDKLQRLRRWYKFMREENVVLEFDPEIPPNPGVSNRGGFAYRPRVESDGDLLIRVNRHTVMTSEGRIFWALPEPGDEP